MTILHRTLLSLACVVAATAASAADGRFDLTGHTKFRLTGQAYPDNSIFRDIVGSNTVDVQADLRLNLNWRKRGWTVDGAYQLVGLYGDSVELGRNLPGDGFLIGRLPADDRRLFDLTKVFHDQGKQAALHRLDRLWVGYASDKTVVRFGRQALSWGNGLFYAPMDLVNPFDPSTIDTEYKAGDDMLYGQYLRDNGDDLQGAIVIRRNLLTGDVESDQATYSLKYHGFTGEFEYDLFAAQSFGDVVLGLGGSRSVGGAVGSADVVITDTDSDTYVQLVANINYSWTLGGKNMTGILEYYHNGFGQPAGQYDPLSLAANPDLLLRLSRGELFALGKNYLATTVQIEMTPLWMLAPVVLANIGDPSTLLQLTTSYSVSDSMTFLGSINLPIGADGTEFGGIDAGIPGRYLSSDAGFFAQLAWYF